MQVGKREREEKKTQTDLEVLDVRPRGGGGIRPPPPPPQSEQCEEAEALPFHSLTHSLTRSFPHPH